MKIKNIAAIIFVSVVSLIGCSVKTELAVSSKPTDESSTTPSLKYFKDKFGICYARVDSNTGYSIYVASITALPTTAPCDKL